MQNLRERLRWMGQNLPVVDHAKFLEQLRREYEHTIAVVDAGLCGLALDDLTCFAYALRLHESNRLAELRKSLHFVNTAFVEHLMSKGVLTPTDTPSTDDLIVYLRRRATHAGIVRGSRVRSKWGVGLVVEHGRDEVPSHYGDGVKYFIRPPLELIEGVYDSIVHRVDVRMYSCFNHSDNS